MPPGAFGTALTQAAISTSPRVPTDRDDRCPSKAAVASGASQICSSPPASINESPTASLPCAHAVRGRRVGQRQPQPLGHPHAGELSRACILGVLGGPHNQREALEEVECLI